MPSPVATRTTAQSRCKSDDDPSDPRVQKSFVKLMVLTPEGDDESFAPQLSQLDRTEKWTSSRNDAASEEARTRTPLRSALRSASSSPSPIHEAESRDRYSSPARTADRARPPAARAGRLDARLDGELAWGSESRERRVSFCATITVRIIPAIVGPVRADA